MRKRLTTSLPSSGQHSESDPAWLDLDALAEVEITSEEAAHPIEAALLPDKKGSGWRAAQPGEQILRLRFGTPQSLRRIRLRFQEADTERTQEFVLRWAPSAPDHGGEEFRDIVRQQYHFSPQGAVEQLEDYSVNLDEVVALELKIIPDTTGGDTQATLADLRLW